MMRVQIVNVSPFGFHPKYTYIFYNEYLGKTKEGFSMVRPTSINCTIAEWLEGIHEFTL